jgi:two-component system LytT family response regulator
MSLKTLIVDDEPIARRILREELELMRDVEIVGEADTGSLALEKIAREKPDLVLLDLQMPVMGGLEVVRHLNGGTHLPVIVIVTAYYRFALEAFDAGAIDYLLKPVGHDRLIAAVERARRLTGQQALTQFAKLKETAESLGGAATRRIIGRLGEEFLLLRSDEIYAFQAEGSIVWIVTANGRCEATQTLRALDKGLTTTCFRRIHRNAIVNVNHVRKISALSSQRWLLTLTNSQQFVVSKRQARNVRRLLRS